MKPTSLLTGLVLGLLVFSISFMQPTVSAGEGQPAPATSFTMICPQVLVDCEIGYVPVSYVGEDGCTDWKCIPKVDCPSVAVMCELGTEPVSYIGDDGCTNWKCVSKPDVCAQESVVCELGSEPFSYVGEDGCIHWKCMSVGIKPCPSVAVTCPAGFEPFSYIGKDGCTKWECIASLRIKPTCPQVLVDCVAGEIPQSYVDEDGCTNWKCIPKAEVCPQVLVDCAAGEIPKSYIDDKGCLNWKCVSKPDVCAQELVDCEIGYVPVSYVGEDGCMHWKCVPSIRIPECPSVAVTCELGTEPLSYIDDKGCLNWKCVPFPRICPDGCTCSGSMVACPVTETRPVTVVIVETLRGTEAVRIAKVEDNKLEIESESVSVASAEAFVVEEAKLYMKTPVGNVQVKVLPDEASSRAIEATAVSAVKVFELTEENAKPVYYIKGTREARVIAVFPVTMEIEAKISAESGAVLSVTKPWWSFLAW